MNHTKTTVVNAFVIGAIAVAVMGLCMGCSTVNKIGPVGLELRGVYDPPASMKITGQAGWLGWNNAE